MSSTKKMPLCHIFKTKAHVLIFMNSHGHKETAKRDIMMTACGGTICLK